MAAGAMLRMISRFLTRAVAATLLLALLLAGGCLYWLGTPHGLGWIARAAVSASAGRLVLDGVQGSLYDRITITRAAYKDASLDMDARTVVLQWRPRALLGREISITELAIDDLRISSTGGDAEPPRLPATIRLPFNVALADARIRRIELAPDRQIQDLHFRLRAGADAHELELLSIAVMDANATGVLRVHTEAPYAASGKFGLTGKVRDEPINASVTVGGNLDALQLKATAAARGASVSATGLLRLFTALPLENLALNAENLDLAKWDQTLPRTRIELALATRMPAPGQFIGTVNAMNHASGSIDTQHIPLTHARFGFSGGGKQWTLSAIDIGLGKAGVIRGSGTIADTDTRLELALTAIDTAQLHAKLKPLVVSGLVTLTGDAGAQQLVAKLDGADARLELVARHAAQVITIDRGELRAADARIDFTGSAALAAERAFSVNANFANVDPARFIDAPPARLNGKVKAQGVLAPEWQARVSLAIANSRLRQQPLAATADFSTSAKQLFSGQAHATLAGNRLEVSGRFGEPGDRLQWSLAAANLKAIDDTLAGNMQAQGTFSGHIDQPAIDFKMTARGLTAGGVSVNTIDGDGMLNAGTDGALRLTARLGGIKTGTTTLDELKLDARGTRLRHDITATLRGSNIDASLRAAGGLDASLLWNGTLSALEARGRLPFQLTTPARISAGRDLLVIEELRATALGGTVGPLTLRAAKNGITTSGTITGIRAQALLAYAPKSGIDARDLTLGGRWNVTLSETLSGSAAIYREAGDLGMRTGDKLALGLNQLQLNLTAQGDAVDAALDMQSARMGTLAAQIRTRLERRDGAWALPLSAPLEGRVALDMQSLAWVSALLPQIDKVEGRIATRLTIAGTAGQPLISGNASADAVQIRAIGPGLNLSDGVLRADFDGGTLKISKLYLKAGDGKIEADGVADLSQGLRSMEVNVRAERAHILSSPQLTAVLSGTGRAGLRDLQLTVDGKFRIDEGRYDLGSERKPELGDDVVITGQPVAEAREKPMKIALDVTVDLSDNFVVRGHGLDALLGGAMRITSRGDALQALGTIRTVRGEYFAFGQLLAIERGELNFSGPLANPGLNLRAVRKVRSVEVGVEASGSLQRPVVKLVSDPVMPDSDRLGWLVLGRDPQTASAAELAILQAAALTSGTRQSAPLQKQIAEGLGLDEFGVSQGEGTMGVLALGKRITDRLTVRLEQSVGGTAGGLLKLDYLLSERWRLEGTAGAESAADVLFTLRFD